MIDLRKWFALCASGLVLTTTLIGQTATAQEPAHPTPSTQSRPSAPIVKDERFHSAALSREMPYRIYLPSGYATSTQRYPVLYLLHGLHANFGQWDGLPHLPTSAAGLDWIIVMPDADNSWYVNSATVPRDKFEDYILKDLIAEIDAKYRTLPNRNDRAIAGLSMGGYGAMKFALRRPELFFFAGSLSGGLDPVRYPPVRPPDEAAWLLEVFGSPGNPARASNNVFELLQKSTPADLPYLYLVCGESDRFLAVNREFVADLARRHVLYEYHENPGDHEWSYWDREVAPLLSALQEHFRGK